MNTQSRLSLYDLSSSVQSTDSRSVEDTTGIMNVSPNDTTISDVPSVSDGGFTNYVNVDNATHSTSVDSGNPGP